MIAGYDEPAQAPDHLLQIVGKKLPVGGLLHGGRHTGMLVVDGRP